MSELPSQTIHVKDLSTKSVVLYPSRAHITRDINDIPLKPGANTIELIGLTPTIDEHSVQVDGRGAATIIDMTVDLVPNRDIFEEVYPDEEEAESDRETEDKWYDSDDAPEEIKTIVQDIKTLKDEHRYLDEEIKSINHQMTALDKYSSSLKAGDSSPDQVRELLKAYREERAALFQAHATASSKLDVVNKNLARRQHDKIRADSEENKKTEKEAKEKSKAIRIKYLRRAEKRRAAEHIRNERLRFWPKKVYRILLQLETTSLDTPSSSRRNSLGSVTLAGLSHLSKDEDQSATTAVSLSLSYVTKEAKWGPRYDISINTIQKSATLVYRTEFINHTSETWNSAKVSFSTSQTTYQGLDDVVPHLHPWHVKLAEKNARFGKDDSGLYSEEEKFAPKSHRAPIEVFDRTAVFGKDGTAYVAPDYDSSQARQKWGAVNTNNNALQDYQMQLMLLEAQNKKRLSMARHEQRAASGVPVPPPPAPVPFGAQSSNISNSSGLFGNASTMNNTSNSGALFGNTTAFGAQPQPQMPQMPISQVPVSQMPVQRMAHMAPQGLNQLDGHDVLENFDFDSFLQNGNLEFEELSLEDHGMTQTYEIPGTRSLVPSSQTRRHKIASLNADNVALSHIAVPKLRAAAFLRAKIRNPSSNITLLKGSGGVTVDGSFLGNMTIPRVAPSQLFDLPLGVDPSIHISYPKPTVHRSTQGLINKESQQRFSRAIWLTNTKSTPVDLLVLDQVPVSQDERLRIELLNPISLHKEGATVRAGLSAKEAAASESGAAVPQSYAAAKNVKWGSATATLKKEGEIDWNVRMEKANACLLKLEYEAKLPPNERITSA